MRDRSPLRTWIVIAIAAAFYWVAWGDLARFRTSIDFNFELFEDFMGPYLRMGVVEDPSLPVEGFLYSPFFALLLRPLGHVSVVSATWIWLVVQVVASAAVVVLPLLILRPRGLLRDAYLFVALTSFPAVHSFHWGQVSALLVAGGLLALLAGRTRCPMWAGICLALAISVKFYPVLWLVPFLCIGDRKVTGACGAASVVFLVVVPLVWLGAGEMGGFYVAIADAVALYHESLWHDAPNMQYLPAVLARAAGGGDSVFTLAAYGALAVSIACVATMVLTARRVGVGALPWAAAVTFAMTPLVVSPSWPHYFTFLPFCQLACASMLLDGSRSSRERRVGMAAVVLSVLLSSAVVFRVVDDPVRYGELGLLAAADIVILVVTLCVRPRPDVTGDARA